MSLEVIILGNCFLMGQSGGGTKFNIGEIQNAPFGDATFNTANIIYGTFFGSWQTGIFLTGLDTNSLYLVVAGVRNLSGYPQSFYCYSYNAQGSRINSYQCNISTARPSTQYYAGVACALLRFDNGNWTITDVVNNNSITAPTDGSFYIDQNTGYMLIKID